MPHSLDLTWDQVSRITERACTEIMGALLRAEEAYQDLVEAVGGRTDAQFAEQLFFSASPPQSDIDKVTDARNAMIALHQLYQAAAGTAAIAQEDRLSKFRRFT